MNADLAAVRERAELLRTRGKSLDEAWLHVVAKDMDDLADEVERLRTRRGYASQRLDKARTAAEELLKREQQHSGSGRDGHLNEADLVPLFEALGAVYLDQPDPQVFASSDGDPE